MGCAGRRAIFREHHSGDWQGVLQVARSTAADVELALDAAHKAKGAWGRTSTTERSNILNKIADRIEANLPMLAAADTGTTANPSARRWPRICL
jgi:acyl-CoA reductase-like NAD-dependent aldehyde dehydrogenase